MELVILMSGAEGEKAHKAHKEGDGSHRRHACLLFCLWSV